MSWLKIMAYHGVEDTKITRVHILVESYILIPITKDSAMKVPTCMIYSIEEEVMTNALCYYKKARICSRAVISFYL